MAWNMYELTIVHTCEKDCKYCSTTNVTDTLLLKFPIDSEPFLLVFYKRFWYELDAMFVAAKLLCVYGTPHVLCTHAEPPTSLNHVIRCHSGQDHEHAIMSCRVSTVLRWLSLPAVKHWWKPTESFFFVFEWKSCWAQTRPYGPPPLALGGVLIKHYYGWVQNASTAAVLAHMCCTHAGRTYAYVQDIAMHLAACAMVYIADVHV